MPLTCHPYAAPHDLDVLLAFLRQIRPPERAADFPSAIDLRELLALSQVQADTALWRNAAGQLAAYSLVDQYNNLLFEWDPQLISPDLPGEIIAWGVARRRARPAEDDEPPTLDASCSADNLERIALLEAHGFVREPVYSIHLARDLSAPISQPVLPPGFTIRPAGGAAEAEAWVVLHRAAFGTERMELEERLAMLAEPEYDPQLDLVAVAPDGRLAAYCMVQISREENARTGRSEGYTDPVATHPDFQRRGLARALLLTGLHLLKDRGIATALMGTSSENTPMLETARSVGFGVVSTGVWFSKPV